MLKLKQFLFSTKLAGFFLIVFALSMAVATFIENDYSTADAYNLVYGTWWFEMVLFLLATNFIAQIDKYKLWSINKLPILLFHLAFVFIIFGAFVTRYFGVEGVMHIREGETSDFFYSDAPYLQIVVDNNEWEKQWNWKFEMSELYQNKIDEEINFKDKTAQIKSLGFIPYEETYLEELPKGEGETIFHFVFSSRGTARNDQYIKKGELKNINNILFNLGDSIINGAINILETEDGGWHISSPFALSFMQMSTQKTDNLKPDIEYDLYEKSLYRVGENLSFVIAEIKESAKISHRMGEKEKDKPGLLTLEIEVDGEKKTLEVKSTKGKALGAEEVQVGSLNFRVFIGSQKVPTPFKVKLQDFRALKYPGSNNPSSFESDVTVIDKDEIFDYSIYMNHILDYRGYRLFQSSYDPDEMGTVLSVNKDFWGTWFSYIGYFGLFGAMILSLFWGKSRFSFLIRKIKGFSTDMKWIVIPLVFSFFAKNINAQDMPLSSHYSEDEVEDFLSKCNVPEEHAMYFSTIVVQDFNGRMQPMHTMASESLRKIYKKNNFAGYTPEQVLVCMLKNPTAWFRMPIVYVKKNVGINEIIGNSQKYASVLDFFDGKGNFILDEYLQKATQKKPSSRNKFDKEVIELNERLSVLNVLLNGEKMRIFPRKGDIKDKWYTDEDYTIFPKEDTSFVKNILKWYVQILNTEPLQISKADSIVSYIKKYQGIKGADVNLSEEKIASEIKYNRANIFEKLYKYELLWSFVIFVLAFVLFFRNKSLRLKKLNWAIVAISYGLVLYHLVGLIWRWKLSGHAPWSNGYESVIFISWIVSVSGLWSATKNYFTLAGAFFLTSIMLWIAHMSWFDPAITNLVPVLNSYWLMIHVSVITSSYAPLLLSALLSLISFVLYVFSNNKNFGRIEKTTTELFIIAEVLMIVGVFLLSIGTFLGGIWANESWGRYWAWDPKETWALISIMIYAFVLHMRIIPNLNKKVYIQFASVVASFSILFTYFGVNFYLSGLHSYAKGDPVPIPTFVYIIALSIFAILALGTIKYNKNKN